MLKNLKTVPFVFLTALRNSFLGRAIGKINPLLKLLKPIYNKIDLIFFKLFWSQGDVIEVQGSKMFVDVFHPDLAMRQTFRHYALDRIHEETTTELFRKTAKKGDVVLDVGANIGYFTLLASSIVGTEGKVYSFEPEPRNFGYLTKNIALNNYSQTMAWQKAVSNQPGHVKLFLCPYDTGHHTIQQFEGIRSYNPQLAGQKEEFVEVEMVRLDDLFSSKLKPVNIIKMDVEGAELLALEGMEGIIKSNENLVMFLEFFPLLIKKMGHSPEAFLKKLFAEFGFTIFIVADDYSMESKHLEKKFLAVTTPQDVMNFCKNENDHVNLIAEKGPRYAVVFNQ